MDHDSNSSGHTNKRFELTRVSTLRGRTGIRTVLLYDDTSTSVEITPECKAREGVSVDGGFTLGASERRPR